MTTSIDAFNSTLFSHGATTRTVYERGNGPGIVVMTEMPGITPSVLGFAQRLVDAGYTVSLPDLFGEAGRAPSGPYIVNSIVRGCISKEFHAFATDAASPATVWLRALAADLHKRCGGPGVGAIGMCFTGGFALAMMVDEAVVAPALSQPSLPFSVGAKRKKSLGVSEQDLHVIKERAAAGCSVLGMRFTEDRAVPAERFERLRAELGHAFIGIEIDSSPDNEHDIRRFAHSVVTEDLVDEPGHPTRQALDQLMEFFAARLK